MAVTRVTVKGQVTIPRAIRSAMSIRAGDSMIVMAEGERVVMVPVKRRSLSELRGSLRVDKRFDRAEERRIAQEYVARHVMGVTPNDAD